MILLVGENSAWIGSHAPWDHNISKALGPAHLHIYFDDDRFLEQVAAFQKLVQFYEYEFEHSHVCRTYSS